MLMSRINRRISSDTAGPHLDFQRQYDRKPARCQCMTVSGQSLRHGGSVRDNCPSLSGDTRATAGTSHDALAANYRTALTRLASIAR